MNDNKKDVESQIVFFDVYVLWCRCTNQFYVGVTQQKVTRRIRQHRRGKQFVDKQIQEIGWENWDWWVVESHVTSNRITEREQYWVDFFGSVFPHGYNKTGGGIGKIIVTEETREIIRQKALARDMSGENNPHYGKTHTEEVKAAQSARMKGENNPCYGKSPSNKGVPWTEEQKAAQSARMSGEKNGFYGKHHTEEAKEKNRQAHLGKPGRKGIPCSEEAKAKLRAKALARNVSGENNPFFGKKHTKEAKEKNRQAQLDRTPWNKGKKMTEEQKAKMREKRAAKENLAAANSTPTSLSTLSDAVILQQSLRA